MTTLITSRWHATAAICGRVPNLTGVDPVSGELVPLFHPRRDRWAEHFQFRGVRIEGLTPVGRATVHVLAMNDARRLELRSELLAPAVTRAEPRSDEDWW